MKPLTNPILRATVVAASRPSMSYDQVEVMVPVTEASPDGRAHSLENPTWELATVTFEDVDAAVVEAGEYGNVFDMLIELASERWYLQCCSLETLNLRNHDVAVSFAHARLLA